MAYMIREAKVEFETTGRERLGIRLVADVKTTFP